MNKLTRLYAVTIGIILLFSCQSENRSDIEKVAQSIKDNTCRMEAISKYVDESWNAAMEEMGTMLPDWLPDEERQKILNLRYASLFRLFETYKDFDKEVHMLVDSMEMLDANWADSLRTLSQENQILEMRLDSIYATVQDAEMEKEMMKKVDDLQSQPCPDNLLQM